MNKKLQLIHLTFFIFLFVTNYAQVSVWKKNSKQQKNNSLSLSNNSAYSLDIDLLLNATNDEGHTLISFPDGNNNLVDFKVKQSHVLPLNLQNKFSSIYSFRGYATNGSGKTIRFTFSKEYGLKEGINNNNNGRLNITPLNKTEHTFSFKTKKESNEYACYTDEISVNQFNLNDNNNTNLDINDNKLRRYRIAISTTGEYSNYFLNGNELNDTEKITKVLTAASVERINELFEIDYNNYKYYTQ